MNDQLRTALRTLRLSGLTESLEIRLQEAASNRLNHIEFLELILQDELAVRQERQILKSDLPDPKRRRKGEGKSEEVQP